MNNGLKKDNHCQVISKNLNNPLDFAMLISSAQEDKC